MGVGEHAGGAGSRDQEEEEEEEEMGCAFIDPRLSLCVDGGGGSHKCQLHHGDLIKCLLF